MRDDDEGQMGTGAAGVAGGHRGAPDEVDLIMASEGKPGQASTLDPQWTRPRSDDEAFLKYRRYRCPDCATLHKSETRAQECCPPEVAVVYLDEKTGIAYESVELLLAASGGTESTSCPQCGGKHVDAFDAATCCMWKTHSPAQRWHMVRQLMLGDTWDQAIAAASSVH